MAAGAPETIRERTAEHDELRQVLVQRAEPVMDPRAERRKEAIQQVPAGVELQLRSVVVVRGPHGADEGDVVELRPDVRPLVSNFDAGATATREPRLQRVDRLPDLLLGVNDAQVL